MECDWRGRSNEDWRSIENQQHIDNTGFGGETIILFKAITQTMFEHSQNNEIETQGAEEIAEALAINKTLTTLALRVEFSSSSGFIININGNLKRAT